MVERKEPTISGARSESEAHARRSQESAQGEPARQPSHPQRAASRKPIAQHSQRPVVVKSVAGPMALFLVVVAIGFSAFSYWQLQLTQEMLRAADVRIAQLESQLTLTDDEASASVTALQAKIKVTDSEIRKLWGVSYDTNRKRIAENLEAVTALKKTLATAQAQNKVSFDSAQTDIKFLNELVDSQQVSLAQIEQKNTAIIAMFDKGAKTNEAIEKRIAVNEEAIEAIDAFRRSINQQLLQLKSATSP